MFTTSNSDRLAFKMNHVARARETVGRQRALIWEMRRKQNDCSDAEALLVIFERSLILLVSHLRDIQKEEITRAGAERPVRK